MAGENRRPCILIVDDEPFVPRVLELKFSSLGWRTVVARSGKEALEALGRVRPDVMITDISMPGMTGCELCRAAEEFRRENPFMIIVVTSRTEGDLRAWVGTLSEVYFFEKPVSPKAISEHVSEYIARRDSARVAVTAAEGV